MLDDFPRVLQAARRGAEDAWAAIYRELAPSVIGYLRAQRASEPEDITGQVFLEVVRDLHRFEGTEGEFRSWVFSIAHVRLLDERRKAARRPTAPVPADELVAYGGTADVEEEALSVLASHRVARVLAILTPDQRDVLLLRIVAGLSVEQVAEVLNKRPGSVRVLQYRGLGRLRREFARGSVTR